MSDRGRRAIDDMDRAVIASPMQQRFGAPVAAQQGLLLTGMHRSGTSALTRVLGMLGCALPGTLMGANDADRTGHRESDSICALNDEVLQIIGRNWRDWLPIDERALASPPVRALQPEARALLASEWGDAPLFVLRDPRIAVLAPFWLETFAKSHIEPAIVCPVRHPVEVARALARRDGIDEGEAHLIWLRHVLAAETATRGRPRTFTTYDQLLHDWRAVVERIGAELGVTWPRSPESRQADVGAFLAGALRHHAVESAESRADPHLSKWTNAVHAILERWAEQGEATADHGTLDEIAAAFDAASPAFAGLVSRGGAAVEGLQALDAGGEARAPARMAAANPELAAVAAKLKAAEARIQALRDRLHDLDSRLRQRDEEVSQAWAEVSTARADAEHRSAEANALSTRLAESESWVFRLAEERQVAERDLAIAQMAATRLRQERDSAQAALCRVNDDLADARARHRQLDADLAAAVAARAEALCDLRGVIELMTVEAQARADVISAERDDARAMLNAERARAEAAEAGCAEQAGLLDKARGELAVLARVVVEVSETAESRRAEAERAKAEAVRAATKAERASAEAERAKAEAERFRAEAEAVRDELANETHRAGESSDHARWLAEVAAALQKRAWWWGLLPGRFAEARLHRRLKRRGLFDGDAYRARYPDVGDAGVSPIHHYLRHGFHENRERPV